MIATLVGILGLSYAGATVLSALVMLAGLVIFAYGAANLSSTNLDLNTGTVVSKTNPIMVIITITGILFLADTYFYDKNARDCNIMQAEMTVTYAAMENSPRTFMEDVNVCRNVNPDNTYSDWYVDSIRK